MLYGVGGAPCEGRVPIPMGMSNLRVVSPKSVDRPKIRMTVIGVSPVEMGTLFNNLIATEG